MSALLPFQIEGVNFLLDTQHAMLCSEMGLGKTVQGCDALAQISLQKHHTYGLSSSLIICPKPIKLTWEMNLIYWGAALPISTFIVKTGKDNIPHWADHIIVNYELAVVPHIAKQLMQRTFDAVICDEAHRLRSLESNWSKTIIGKRGPLTGRGHYKWFFSATLMPNRPMDLFPILFTHFPDALGEFADYVKYGIRFCGGYAMEFRGASHIEDLRARIKPFFLAHQVKDVYPQMPDVLQSEIYMDVGDILSPDGTKIVDETNTPTATLRRAVGMAKMPFVVEYVKDKLEDVEKIVVFAFHRDVIDGIVCCLTQDGIQADKIYGGTSDKERERIKAAFINGSLRVLVCQIQAGGQGVDGLQYACNTLVFAEIDWTPGDMDQVPGRLRRIGQLYPVYVYLCIAQNTINEAMMGSYFRKKKVINQLFKPRKEDKPMSIEQSLERIAAALEKIAGGGVQLGTNATVSPPADKPKGKPKAEPVPAANTLPPGVPGQVPMGVPGQIPGQVPGIPQVQPNAGAVPQASTGYAGMVPGAGNIPVSAPPQAVNNPAFQVVKDPAEVLLNQLFQGTPEGVETLLNVAARPFGLATFSSLEQHPQFWPQAIANINSAIAQKQQQAGQVQAQPGLGQI